MLRKVPHVQLGTLALWLFMVLAGVLTGAPTALAADDTVAPVTTASPAYVNGAVVLTLTASDDDSGVATTYYKVGSAGSAETYTAPLSRSTTEPIIYWSVDTAGNVEAEKTYTLTRYAYPTTGPAGPVAFMYFLGAYLSDDSHVNAYSTSSWTRQIVAGYSVDPFTTVLNPGDVTVMTGVSTRPTIMVAYNNNITNATWLASNVALIHLYGPDGGEVAFDYYLNPLFNKGIWVTPRAVLSPLANYRLVVGAGIRANAGMCTYQHEIAFRTRVSDPTLTKAESAGGFLRLEGLPLNMDLEYDVAADGVTFDDANWHPFTANGRIAELPSAGMGLIEGSRVRVRYAAYPELPSAECAVTFRTTAAPTFSGATLNGTTLTLRGLPETASDLEYRIAADGISYGVWAHLSYNGTTAAVDGSGLSLVGGVTMIDVRYEGYESVPPSDVASGTFNYALGMTAPLTAGLDTRFVGDVTISPTALGAPGTVALRLAGGEIPANGPEGNNWLGEYYKRLSRAGEIYGLTLKGETGGGTNRVTFTVPYSLPAGVDVSKVGVWRSDTIWAWNCALTPVYVPMNMWTPLEAAVDTANGTISVDLSGFDGQGQDFILGVFYDDDPPEALYYTVNSRSSADATVTFRLSAVDEGGIAQFVFERTNGKDPTDVKTVTIPVDALSIEKAPADNPPFGYGGQSSATDSLLTSWLTEYNYAFTDTGLSADTWYNYTLLSATDRFGNVVTRHGYGDGFGETIQDPQEYVDWLKTQVLADVPNWFAAGDSPDRVTQDIDLPREGPVLRDNIEWKIMGAGNVIDAQGRLNDVISRPFELTLYGIISITDQTNYVDFPQAYTTVSIPVVVFPQMTLTEATLWGASLHLEGLPTYTQELECNVASDGVTFDDANWVAFTSTDSGANVDVSGQTITAASKVRVRWAGYPQSTFAEAAIALPSGVAPGFTGATLDGTTMTLKGLPLDAPNLECRIAPDGVTFGEWSTLTVDDRRAAVDVSGLDLVGNLSQIEVRYQAADAVPASSATTHSFDYALGTTAPLRTGTSTCYDMSEYWYAEAPKQGPMVTPVNLGDGTGTVTIRQGLDNPAYSGYSRSYYDGLEDRGIWGITLTGAEAGEQPNKVSVTLPYLERHNGSEGTYLWPYRLDRVLVDAGDGSGTTVSTYRWTPLQRTVSWRDRTVTFDMTGFGADSGEVIIGLFYTDRSPMTDDLAISVAETTYDTIALKLSATNMQGFRYFKVTRTNVDDPADVTTFTIPMDVWDVPAPSADGIYTGEYGVSDPNLRVFFNTYEYTWTDTTAEPGVTYQYRFTQWKSVDGNQNTFWAGNAGGWPATSGVRTKDDSTAPETIAITTPLLAPASGWFTGSVPVDLSATDEGWGVTKISYSLDGGDVVETSGDAASLTVIGEGSHTLAYWATDAAGNVEVAKSMTVAIDSLAPTGGVVINAGAAFTTSSGVTLTLDGSDGAVLMRCSNDEATWSDWTAFATSLAWNLTSGDGAKTVSVEYQDAAGNTSGTYSDTITLDGTVPVTTASVAPEANSAGWTMTNPTIMSLDADDSTAGEDGSGVAVTEYSLDGGTTWLPGHRVNVTSQGSTVVMYRSTDNAGNVEAAKGITVRLDSIKPVAKALSDVSVLRGRNLSFRYRVNDVRQTVRVHIRISKPGSTWSRTIALGARRTNRDLAFGWTCGLARGAYTWKVVASDAAGNIGVSPAKKMYVR